MDIKQFKEQLEAGEHGELLERLIYRQAKGSKYTTTTTRIEVNNGSVSVTKETRTQHALIDANACFLLLALNDPTFKAPERFTVTVTETEETPEDGHIFQSANGRILGSGSGGIAVCDSTKILIPAGKYISEHGLIDTEPAEE